MKGFKEKKNVYRWKYLVLFDIYNKNKLLVMENENKVEYIYKMFESSFLYIE